MGHPADTSASEGTRCCYRPRIVSAPCTHYIFFCPGIAQPNVTHLAWSSTGWAHEWTDTGELLCFSSRSGRRNLFHCLHCSHSAESMTALFHAFPRCAQGQPAALTTSNKHFTFFTHGSARGMPLVFPEQLWDLQRSVYSLCCGPILSRRCFKGFSRPVHLHSTLSYYWATGRL